MRPKIEWGVGFANTLEFDNHMSDELAILKPKEQYERTRTYATSTTNDAWNYGYDYEATFTLRMIPLAQWDGATGVKQFVAQSMRGRPFKFYPDRDNAPSVFYNVVLLSPLMTAFGELEGDGTKSVALTVRTIDNEYFEGFY